MFRLRQTAIRLVARNSAAASLILPGSGQLLLGQRRWAVYAAVEAIGWLVHLEAGRSGRQLRTEYRDLAWHAARSAAPEPRRDGDWEYYDHWVATLEKLVDRHELLTAPVLTDANDHDH